MKAMQGLKADLLRGCWYVAAMSRDIKPGKMVNKTLLGEVWLTYYYKAVEDDYPGAADTTLYDGSCRPIADVSAAFSDVICHSSAAGMKMSHFVFQKSSSEIASAWA